MIQQTSLWAYDEHKKTGSMGKQEALVYACIRAAKPYYGITDNEISLFTGIRINAVCGRRNALYKKRFIKSIGKRPCQRTERYCLAWVAL